MALQKELRAVVTGAGGGLGLALCRQLGLRGARVLASDLTDAGAQAGAAAAGAGGSAFRCDVTRLEDVMALAAEAERLFGGCDLLVNNAGVALAGRADEIATADWRWLLEVNLLGVVHGLNAFVPAMRRAKRGHVLNVASAAGLLSSPLMGPYNASKAAVVALSETLAAELQGGGVGVTVLCPMFFRTGIADGARGGPPWVKELIGKLMTADKLGADGVARYALAACDAGKLYALPHRQSRFFWRMKRLMPERVAKETRRGLEKLARKFGLDPKF